VRFVLGVSSLGLSTRGFAHVFLHSFFQCSGDHFSVLGVCAGRSIDRGAACSASAAHSASVVRSSTEGVVRSASAVRSTLAARSASIAWFSASLPPGAT
jgi:hypothetical protein